MKRERLTNNGSTTLAATITSADTSISVADGSVFPSDGNFRLRVDSEQLLCTARSGNTLTVVRGDEGTTPAGHVSGATIVANMTVGNMHQFLADNVAGADGSRPPFGLFDASGNRLTSADFTTVNLSDSTISDQDGSICLRMAATGSSTKLTVLARTAPATPNALIVGLQPLILPDTTGKLPCAIAGFRDSSGKLFTIGLKNSGSVFGIVVEKYDSTASINSTPWAKQALAMVGPTLWLKAVDDGTNLKFYVGDGVEWVQVYSEARGTFMAGGPSQVCWGLNAGANGIETLNRLVHWSEG